MKRKALIAILATSVAVVVAAVVFFFLMGVVRANVSTDADTSFGMQSLFTLTGSASVLKDALRSTVIGMSENDIQNQLLETWIVFHFVARRNQKVKSRSSRGLSWV